MIPHIVTDTGEFIALAHIVAVHPQVKGFDTLSKLLAHLPDKELAHRLKNKWLDDSVTSSTFIDKEPILRELKNKLTTNDIIGYMIITVNGTKYNCPTNPFLIEEII
jgi:hypothetical protein